MPPQFATLLVQRPSARVSANQRRSAFSGLILAGLLLCSTAVAVLLGGSPAQAQFRTWTNRQGRTEEAEFQRLLPGGIVVLKYKVGRIERVQLDQLSTPDQDLVTGLFMKTLGEQPEITPFGNLSWEDSPSTLLTKLKADGYERLAARVKKKTGRDEYDLGIIEENGEMRVAGLPVDATTALVGIERPVMSPEWELFIEVGPVWIEGTECLLRAKYESNFGLLVDNQESLERASLPTNGLEVAAKECILPAMLVKVDVEYVPPQGGSPAGVPPTAVKALHSVMLEKYLPLLEINLQVNAYLSARAAAIDKPDAILQQARQSAATAKNLPNGEGRVSLAKIYTGMGDGFNLRLTDAGGHIIDAAIGRTQGVRGGLNIGYEVGRQRRQELQDKADKAGFRTAAGGKNRAKDI